MKLIITRPLEDAVALAHKLTDMGHQAISSPLLEIVANSDIKIPDRPWAALLVTSANGVRCLPNKLVFHDLRVIAVGAQSAQAARDCGFRHVESHGGDVHGLASWIAGNISATSGALLYVTGREISGDLGAVLSQRGFEVCRIETYEAKATPLKLSSNEFSNCDGVLLYSPRSAKLWLHEITLKDLSQTAALLHHYCLSPAVAQILPQEWHISVASEPTESALLRLLEPARKGE
jgi:uroporphyrinogen-III synthase